MSYFKYHCPKCNAYYGDAIPFDELPHDKVCENCEKSNINMVKSRS